MGRFNSGDALAEDFVDPPPYQYALSTPIWAIDIDRLEAGHTTGETALKEELVEEQRYRKEIQKEIQSLFRFLRRTTVGIPSTVRSLSAGDLTTVIPEDFVVPEGFVDLSESTELELILMIANLILMMMTK